MRSVRASRQPRERGLAAQAPAQIVLARPARSPARGRLRGNSRPTACIDGQRRRARREGEQDRCRWCARPGRPPHRTQSDGAVVDQRIHRDDVVETAERRIEHVADAEIDRARRRGRAACARAPAATSVGATSIATTRRRAAPPRPPARRCRSRHRAGARRAGRPAARTSSVRAHLVAAGAHGGADAADRRIGRQPRPGLDRGAVEVGLELRRGAR